MRRSVITASVFGSLWLAACGSDGEYEVCDVRKESCIERISEVVAARRGSSYSGTPPVEFTTSADRRASASASRNELTDEQLAYFERYYRGYIALDLYPEGYTLQQQDADFIDTVPAFYSISRDTIVIVTDIGNDDERQSYLSMVHEMVHAQQDAELDLGTLSNRYARTADRSLGFRSLIEGEAMTFELEAIVELDGYALESIDWDGYFEDWQQSSLDTYDATDIPDLLTSRIFPYPYGAEMVFETWWDRDRAGIDALFDAPPTSARQVYSWPETEAPGTTWNGDTTLNLQAIPDLGPEWETVNWAHDSMWLVWAMLRRLGDFGGPDGLLALNADVLSIHYNASADHIAAVWRLQLDDETERDTLLAALDGLPGVESSELDDGDVVVVAGDAPGVVTEATPWRSLESVRADTEDAARLRHRHEIAGGRCPHPHPIR